MIFFIECSEISSGNVFLTIRMQVAVSATTDFKCNISLYHPDNILHEEADDSFQDEAHIIVNFL